MQQFDALPDVPERFRRVIGTWDQGRAGTTVVVVAGLHGNEPAGYDAARRVLDALRTRQVPVRGRVVALAGNLQSLGRGQRYALRDLNRGWSDESVARAFREPGSPEDEEQRELIEVLTQHLERDGRRGVIVDLHSTSAPGPPFAILADTLRNRPIAFALGLPVILGLEELLEGTLIEYLVEHGHVAVAVEGGQHDAPDTADRLEAALWLALEAASSIGAADVPERAARRRLLLAASRHVPRVVEVRHRHGIQPGDGFRMDPGFVNFDDVRKGQRLASDVRGELRSPETGCILLPSYQGKGDDGFFVGRPVRRFWLRLSTLMRALRLDRLVTLLPGVSRDPDHHDRLLADPRIARWFTVQIFHLLGYRREAPRGGLRVFSRRRPDHLPPEPLRTGPAGR